MKQKDSTITVGQRLKNYRKNILGLSQQKVAERVQALLGDEECSQQTVGNIETGKIQNSKYLPAIAQVLGISLDYLNPDLKSEMILGVANDRGFNIPKKPFAEPQVDEFDNDILLQNTPKPQKQIAQKPIIYLEHEVPIFETVDLTENGFIITNTPIDYISRPHAVKLEEDAFGIIIRCRSLEPAIRIGNTILVHPRKPPQEGDYCLYFNEKNEIYTIGEYIKEDTNCWITKLYNPIKEQYLNKELWVKCYVIVAIFLERK